MSKPFKMKGSPMQRNFGIGSPVKNDKKKRRLLSPEEQNVIDKRVIEEYQDADKPGGYGAIPGTEKQVKKSLRRQTIKDSYKLSRKELKKILKQQEQTGSVKKGSSKKGSWLHRTFGSTEDLRGTVSGRALRELRAKDIRGQASNIPYEEGYDVTP